MKTWDLVMQFVHRNICDNRKLPPIPF